MQHSEASGWRQRTLCSSGSESWITCGEVASRTQRNNVYDTWWTHSAGDVILHTARRRFLWKHQSWDLLPLELLMRNNLKEMDYHWWNVTVDTLHDPDISHADWLPLCCSVGSENKYESSNSTQLFDLIRAECFLWVQDFISGTEGSYPAMEGTRRLQKSTRDVSVHGFQLDACCILLISPLHSVWCCRIHNNPPTKSHHNGAARTCRQTVAQFYLSAATGSLASITLQKTLLKLECSLNGWGYVVAFSTHSHAGRDQSWCFHSWESLFSLKPWVTLEIRTAWVDAWIVLRV